MTQNQHPPQLDQVPRSHKPIDPSYPDSRLFCQHNSLSRHQRRRNQQQTSSRFRSLHMPFSFIFLQKHVQFLTHNGYRLTDHKPTRRLIPCQDGESSPIQVGYSISTALILRINTYKTGEEELRKRTK